MKTRSSRNKRVAGVYLRGKIFWCRCSLDGRQHRLSLDTEDESAAITRAMEIRANPELADWPCLRPIIGCEIHFM